MNYFRRMMLAASLLASTSVAIGSPPSSATSQDAGTPTRGNSEAPHSQVDSTRTSPTKSANDASPRESSMSDWLGVFLGSGCMNQCVERIRVTAGLRPVVVTSQVKVMPMASNDTVKTTACQACDLAVVRGVGTGAAQVVQPASAVQVSESSREACTDWSCVRLPSASQIHAALMMMGDAMPCSELKAMMQRTNSTPACSGAKPLTVVRVPGSPYPTIMPPPPPFPIAREVMAITAPATINARSAKHVHFATPDLEAHCERITHRGDLVVLEGDVKLHCKKHGQRVCIEAQRVTLNMKDGTFTVDSDAARSTARMALPVHTNARQVQWVPVPPSMPILPPPSAPFPFVGPFSIQPIHFDVPAVNPSVAPYYRPAH